MMNKNRLWKFRKPGFRNFRKKKSLGQNFLINPHVIDKIIAVAEIGQNDIVIEVGPGLGNLTQRLADKAKEVIAVEKDSRLIPILKKEFKYCHKIRIIEEDVLRLKLPEARLLEDILHKFRYKIVANIPYYITSSFIRTVFEKWPRPELIVLTIQKEVAQRIMAKPPHMNLLALSVQYYSEPEIVGYISRNNFRPVPKVDSAIIKLTSRILGAISEVEPQRFPRSQTSGISPRSLASGKLEPFSLIRIGFSEKRKQLAGVLSKKLKISKNEIGEALKKIGVPPNARAENLSLDQWILLRDTLAI